MSNLVHLVTPSIEILHNLNKKFDFELNIKHDSRIPYPIASQVESQYKIYTHLLLETTRDIEIYFSSTFTLNMAATLIEELFECPLCLKVMRPLVT